MAASQPMNRLAQFKTRKKLSQEQLAELLRLNQSTVSRLLRPKWQMPTLEVAARIADATKGFVSMRSWLNGEL